MVYLFSENSFEKPAAFFHAHQSIKQISISTENSALVLLLSRGFLVLDLPHLSFKMNYTPKEWLNYHHFDVSITGQLIACGDGFATVFDSESGNEIHSTLNYGLSKAVLSLNSRSFILSSSDNTMRLFDGHGRLVVERFCKEVVIQLSKTSSPDLVFSLGEHGTVCCYENQNQLNLIRAFKTESPTSRITALFGLGNTIVTGLSSGIVEHYEYKSGLLSVEDKKYLGKSEILKISTLGTEKACVVIDSLGYYWMYEDSSELIESKAVTSSQDQLTSVPTAEDQDVLTLKWIDGELNVQIHIERNFFVSFASLHFEGDSLLFFIEEESQCDEMWMGKVVNFVSPESCNLSTGILNLILSDFSRTKLESMTIDDVKIPWAIENVKKEISVTSFYNEQLHQRLQTYLHKRTCKVDKDIVTITLVKDHNSNPVGFRFAFSPEATERISGWMGNDLSIDDHMISLANDNQDIGGKIRKILVQCKDSRKCQRDIEAGKKQEVLMDFAEISKEHECLAYQTTFQMRQLLLSRLHDKFRNVARNLLLFKAKQ